MLYTFIYLLLFAIILFFLLNYIKLIEKENYSNNIIYSLIYLVIISVLSESLNISNIKESIFIILIFEMFIRLFFNYVINDNNDSLEVFIKDYFIEIVLGIFLNYGFINRVDSVMLDNESLKIMIWLLIAIFIFSRFKYFVSDKKDSLVSSKQRLDRKYREKVILDYAKFKNTYNYVLKDIDSTIKDIIYAVMIYENMHRSGFMRGIDNYFFGKLTRVKKLGIMQIESKTFITDIDSILLSSKKINKIYSNLMDNKKNDLVYRCLKLYCNDEEKAMNINDIYNIIMEFNNIS